MKQDGWICDPIGPGEVVSWSAYGRRVTHLEWCQREVERLRAKGDDVRVKSCRDGTCGVWRGALKGGEK